MLVADLFAYMVFISVVICSFDDLMFDGCSCVLLLDLGAVVLLFAFVGYGGHLVLFDFGV